MPMSFFEQLFKVLWAHNTARFFLIWITITAAAGICVAAAVRRVVGPKTRVATERPISLVLRWRRVGTPGAIAWLAFLTVFLTSYIAMILVWEDFAYYDNSMFTQFTLKGHNYPLQIFPVTGRFLPISMEEFNFVRHFTDSVIGYQFWPIVQLLVFFSIIVILDVELNITDRLVFAILALISPSILTSFSGLIFDERNVLFSLVCLMLSVKRFEQTGSIAWAVAATVSAQLMLYCKETAFLLLLSFAVGRLILRCRNGHYAGWDYDRLWDKESRLDLCFISLTVLFLIYYFAEIGIPGNMNYAVTARQKRAEIALGYIRIDLLAGLLLAVMLGRIYMILSHRVAAAFLWDGLAFGGVAYFLAYLYLSIFGIYYLAPVDLIAVLYVGRFAVLSWRQMRSWVKIGAMLLASIVLLQDVLVSAYAIFERKNVIHAKVEIASVVETQYRNNEGNAIRLFFPFAAPYVIMEFASYLSYRGLPVEVAVDEAGGPHSVVLVSRAAAKDGRCVEWSQIRCRAGAGPAPGDLVVVLPDDDVLAKEASAYREGGELLFSYEPRPLLPPWLSSLFAGLHIGTTRYRHKALPDRWMDGSVTIWK
jgi:hypothetical protein